MLGRREVEKRAERDKEKERQIYPKKGRNQNIIEQGREMLALSSILTNSAMTKGQSMAAPGRPAASLIIATPVPLF